MTQSRNKILENKLTTVEVEAKKTTLEAEMATALEASKVLTPATAEFDEAYGRYLAAKAGIAKIPEELAKAKLAENAEAIATAGAQVGEAIVQLVDGLKIADLLGTAVTGLRYYRHVKTAEDGTETIDTGVVFNPVTKVPTKGTKPAKGAGRTVILDAAGERLSLTKFVLANATDEEKLETSDKFLKYPHTAVDTKPKFEAFCESHGLTGFTYTPAEAGAAEEPAS